MEPENKLFHNGYGNELIKLGYDEKAKRFYSKLIEQNNDYYFCYADLGYLELLNGEFDNAEKLFQKSFSISPRDPATLMYSSFLYYLKNENEYALDYYFTYRLVMDQNIPKQIIRNEIGKNITEYESYFSDNPYFFRIKETHSKIETDKNQNDVISK